MKDKLDKAIERHGRRFRAFIGEGLCEEQALNLADQMFERDRDPQDKRRVCFECQNYVGVVCMKMKDRLGKPQMPLRFVLQNCENFKVKETK